MKVVLMVGQPGSGKSTIATTEFKHLTRINQDELGSREACLKAANEALSRGESIIIDRCNHTKQQRNMWITMARVFGAKVHCIYLNASQELCVKRIVSRQNHPTIVNVSIDKARDIVRKFKNELTVPDPFTDDIDSLLVINVRS